MGEKTGELKQLHVVSGQAKPAQLDLCSPHKCSRSFFVWLIMAQIYPQKAGKRIYKNRITRSQTGNRICQLMSLCVSMMVT